MDRRTFVNLLAAGAASAALPARASAYADPLIERVGLGLFSIPHLLEDDFVGTMELLAGIGYREIETFGPYSFSVPAAHERWDMLTEMLGFEQSGYFGRSPAEFRQVLERFGLTAPSMHIDLGTLQIRMDDAAEAINTVGQEYAGIAAIPEEQRQSLDDYRRLADEFNEIGRQAAERGFKFLYHNHGYGLAPVDGEIPLQVLLERLDPSVVALEMDIYWTLAGGADPVEYFRSYPELYRLVHIKDMSEKVEFSGDGGDPAQWMELFAYMTPVGAGVLDFPRILGAAKEAGVEHFLVERDLAPEPESMLRISYDYLSSLEQSD